MIFSLSVALAYILTNIDGLFFFLTLAFAKRLPVAIAGFVAAQCAVIGGAALLGGAASALSPQWVGMLGLIPVAFGLVELRRGLRGSSEPRKTQTAGPLAGALSVFLALSVDTFVLVSAFFADSSNAFDGKVYLGALIAVITLLVLGVFLSRKVRPSARTEKAFERLSPIVMIIAGMYILMDTATDAM